MLPHCPNCHGEEMTHRFSGVGSLRNGWYCDQCGAGPYRLGTMEEARQNVNTEAQAAQFAVRLLNY